MKLLYKGFFTVFYEAIIQKVFDFAFSPGERISETLTPTTLPCTMHNFIYVSCKQYWYLFHPY